MEKLDYKVERSMENISFLCQTFPASKITHLCCFNQTIATLEMFYTQLFISMSMPKTKESCVTQNKSTKKRNAGPECGQKEVEMHLSFGVLFKQTNRHS